MASVAVEENKHQIEDNNNKANDIPEVKDPSPDVEAKDFAPKNLPKSEEVCNQPIGKQAEETLDNSSIDKTDILAKINKEAENLNDCINKNDLNVYNKYDGLSQLKDKIKEKK